MSVLLTEITTLDEILGRHAAAIGGDFVAYRNHVYRVVNLCRTLSPRRYETHAEKFVVAAVFHDLGIWTDGTFDYLPPSIRLAGEHLLRTGRADWVPEISMMIFQHHKISQCQDRESLAETFRQADWIDVTRGWRHFGVRRDTLRAIFRQWPDAGFHLRLVRLTLGRLRQHPLNPLPMFKL